MELNVQRILFSFVVIAVSAFVHATSGIGFAMLAMAVLSLFMNSVQCTVLVCFLTVFVIATIVWRLRKYISWSILWPPAISMVMGKVLGIVFLMGAEDTFLKKGLGVLLIGFAVYFMLFQEKIKIRPTIKNGLIFGLFAGILGGIYNVSGPFAALYFFPASKSKNEYSASMNMAFLPAGLVGCITHVFFGNVNTTIILPLIIGIVAVVIGTVLGILVFSKLNRNKIAILLYGYSAVMGLVLIIGG